MYKFSLQRKCFITGIHLYILLEVIQDVKDQFVKLIFTKFMEAISLIFFLDQNVSLFGNH